jgi:hypothetical protein
MKLAPMLLVRKPLVAMRSESMNTRTHAGVPLKGILKVTVVELKLVVVWTAVADASTGVADTADMANGVDARPAQTSSR